MSNRPDSGTSQDLQRIRVLIVTSTLHVGGAEQVASTLAQYLDRRQFDVAACYLKENGVVGHAMQAAGVELIPLARHVQGKVDYFTALRLAREVRRRRPHVIHSHDVHALLDCSLTKLLLPGIRHVHTFHFGNYPHKSRTTHRIEKCSWRMPDALVAVGHRQAEAISRTYGIPPARLRVVWNGVSAPQAAIDPEIARIAAMVPRPVIMSISTLTDQKGLPILLDACARIKRAGKIFTLLVIGDGPLRFQIEEQVRQLQLDDCVRLLGWIPNASCRAMPACDLFVQSSLWEAMSVVVLEAMAMKKPIVLTDVGENRFILRDGDSALLIPRGSATALAAALSRLIDEPELANRIAGAAKQRYEEAFTGLHMIRHYQDLYRELVQGPNIANARPAR